MMPVPSHLQGLVIPQDSAIDEQALSADFRCPCGEARFELLHPGETFEDDGGLILSAVEVDGNFFFLLKARCVSCEREHLLFDADFHGWDGFVCHEPAQAALERPPLVPWHCPACGCTAHTGVVHIQTDGREDFIEARVDFPAERWPDGFGWFSLDLTCTGCGKRSPELVSYETA